MLLQRNRNKKALHNRKIGKNRESGKIVYKRHLTILVSKRQKQYILDLIVSPGFYHPHMHISTEAIVEKQHQCNITVALYYIIARYYSRVESQHVCLTHIFFQPK